MTGVVGPLGVRLEEYLFLIIIPIAGILTIEGVKTVQLWAADYLKKKTA